MISYRVLLPVQVIISQNMILNLQILVEFGLVRGDLREFLPRLFLTLQFGILIPLTNFSFIVYLARFKVILTANNLIQIYNFLIVYKKI